MDLTLPPLRPIAVYSPHPLLPDRDRELILAELLPKETLLEYFIRTGIAARVGHAPVVVSIDGYRVPRAIWAGCRPKPGTLISVQAVVRGGGGGKKNPIATVLTIALLVATAGQSAWLQGIAQGAGFGGGLFGVSGGQLLGAAINIAGGMVINALFPPPKPQLTQAQQTGNQVSPTYSLSGGSNRARPFEPMPLFVGTHRIYPDAGAKTYTEFHGDDQVLFQVFDFGYNDVDLSDFRIGTTPIDNYSGVTMQTSGEDGVLTLFPGNVDSQAGAAIALGDAQIVRTSAVDATGLAIEISGLLFGTDTNGNAAPTNITIELVYRAVGAGSWEQFVDDDVVFTPPDSHSGANVVIQNATRTPVRRTYFRSVTQGQYEIGVQVQSVYNGADNFTYELSWTQLRTYQPDTADYTGRKRIALKITASGQISGQVDQFNCVARAKTTVWNGSSWVDSQQSSNPAWWARAVAKGKFVSDRRVWGAGLAAARVDDDAFKAFGAYCDAQGLTFNGVFDQPIAAGEMIDAIALAGRGTQTWASGKLGIVWDAADQPAVAVFSMANIDLDSFEIDYSTEELADEIVGSFINPDLDWQRDTVRATVPGVTTITKVRNIELFGRTNKDLAGRDVNLYAASNVYRAKRYSWTMDWEGMPASRGDVGILSHDLSRFDVSGRLMPGCTDTVLKLSRTVTLEAAGSNITLVRPNGSFATYTVTSGSGDTDTVTLSSALAFDPGDDADHPPMDYRFIYGTAATPGRLVKIERIVPAAYDKVRISVLEETPEYYAYELNPYGYTAPRPNFGNPSIANLALTESGVRAGAGYLVRVAITFDPGTDYGFAVLRTSVAGGPLVTEGETRGRSFVITVPDRIDLIAEVTVYSSLGRLGKFATATATKAIDFAALSPPANVTSFQIDGNKLSWTPVGDIDLDGYAIRFHYGQRATWEDAAPIYSGLVTDNPYDMKVRPAGPVTFLIKAVDAAQMESPEAAAIYTDLGDPPVANVLAQTDLYAAGFPGTIVDGSLSGGDLVADTTTDFYVASDTAPFYKSSDGSAFYATTEYAAMSYETEVYVPDDVLVGSTLTIDTTIVGDPVAIEYRQTGPAPLYTDTDADAFYAVDDSDPFYDPAGDYQTWPGAITARAEPYQFRFTTGQGETQGAITALTLTVDAPDLEDVLEDVVISAAGTTRLPITKAFTAIVSVTATVQADGNGAVTPRILDKDPLNGPLMETLDKTETRVQGLIDARIKGY